VNLIARNASQKDLPERQSGEAVWGQALQFTLMARPVGEEEVKRGGQMMPRALREGLVRGSLPFAARATTGTSFRSIGDGQGQVGVEAGRWGLFFDEDGYSDHAPADASHSPIPISG
jgi:hypothetical protein